MRGVAQPRQLGQVAGEVAHAFQRGAHPERTDDHAQVTRHRTLQGQDVDGALIEAVLQEVDPGIGGNDVLGQVDVGARESCRGLVDGLGDQR